MQITVTAESKQISSRHKHQPCIWDLPVEHMSEYVVPLRQWQTVYRAESGTASGRWHQC